MEQKRISFPYPGSSSLLIDAVHEYRFTSDSPVLLIPQGRFEMIFQTEGEFQHKTKQSENWFMRPSAFIGGLHGNAYSVRAVSGAGRCVGISLRPETAHSLIPEKLNLFENEVVDLASIFGREGRILGDSVINEKTDEAKLDRVEHFFSSKEISANQTRIGTLIKHSLAYADDCRVASLGSNFGLSESHFRRVFREAVGMSAKQYFKIRRVNRAIHLIQNNDGMNLTQIAFALGYFDQSHFIREFKSVTDKTPKQFINVSS